MSARAALRLIRLPGCVSAAVDSTTSALCTAAALGLAAPSGVKLGTVAASSFALYAFGIVDGDLGDVEKDRALHPTRPLPAGALSARTAARVRGFALIIALACAAAAGGGPVLWAAITVAAILVHQRSLRRTRAGPFSMALCRVTNHALGASVVLGASPNGWPAAIPLLIGLWVATLTALSDHEEPRPNTARAVPKYLLALFTLALMPLAAVPHRELALIAIVPLFARLIGPATAARGAPSGRTIGPVIGAAVKGLLLLDAAFLFGYGKIEAGVAVLVVWILVEFGKHIGLRT